MTKKGEKGTYHKPKPRVAVYAGLAFGTLAVGTGNGRRVFDLVVGNGVRKDVAARIAADATTDPVGTFGKGAVIAVGGALISLGADKIGLNKILAKAHAPVRA